MGRRKITPIMSLNEVDDLIRLTIQMKEVFPSLQGRNTSLKLQDRYIRLRTDLKLVAENALHNYWASPIEHPDDPRFKSRIKKILDN